MPNDEPSGRCHNDVHYFGVGSRCACGVHPAVTSNERPSDEALARRLTDKTAAHHPAPRS